MNFCRLPGSGLEMRLLLNIVRPEPIFHSPISVTNLRKVGNEKCYTIMPTYFESDWNLIKSS